MTLTGPRCVIDDRRRFRVELTPAVKEERVRRKIDRPTQLILLAAFISFLFSIYLWFFADKDTGIFVGIWVPSILAFGTLMRLAR